MPNATMKNFHPNPKRSPDQARLAFRVDDFCSAIGISRSTFYSQMKDGSIRTVVIGGRRLVPMTEVERLLSSQDSVQTETV